MKNFTKRIYYLLVALTCVGVAHAQTPLDAIMMKQKESCFALTYDHGSFNEYWEGTVLRTNETIAEVPP